RDRHRRRVRAPQPHHHPAVDRDHAQRGEPDVRGVRPRARFGGRADHRVLRDDRGRGGSRGRTGDRDRAVPAPRVANPLLLRVAEMVTLIPLLPFIGFLVNASFSRRLSKAAAGAVVCGAMIGSFVVSALAVMRLLRLEPESRAIVNSVYTWISSGDFRADVTL